MKELFAWCNANGQISFTEELPREVFSLAHGNPIHVRHLIRERAVAVDASQGIYAVPGLAGSKPAQEKMDALEKFLRSLSDRVAVAKGQGYDVQATVTLFPH